MFVGNNLLYDKFFFVTTVGHKMNAYFVGRNSVLVEHGYTEEMIYVSTMDTIVGFGERNVFKNSFEANKKTGEVVQYVDTILNLNLGD